MHIVRTVNNGFIGLMPRPKGEEQLEREITALKEKGVKVLVSLLEPCETEALGLQDEHALADRHGIDFISHPVPDRGVPADSEQFLSLIIELRDRVVGGTGVVAHCWGGVGRSGLLTAAVLTAMGSSPTAAFREVSIARGATVPEVSVQGAWLTQHRSQVQKGAFLK